VFRVYLPRLEDCWSVEKDAEEIPANLRGSETVLVVEDQESVRRFTVSVLKNLGYRVLEACHAAEALLLVQAREPIQLMITDVVMPGMTGRELAEKSRLMRPEMSIMFISGYSQDEIAQRGVLKPGISLLSKPYKPEELAAKVRELLDRRSESFPSTSAPSRWDEVKPAGMIPWR
jgi:CheY-like chemotaxis protein